MVVRWMLTVIFTLVVAGPLGGIAAAFSTDSPGVTAAVFAAATLGPAAALGWYLFVGRTTVPTDANAEENVESAWFEKASSAAFTDLLIVLAIALTLISVTERAPDPQLLLLGAVVVAMGDVAVRYVRLARRER